MSEPPAPPQPPPSADGASAMERLRRIRGVSWEWDDPSHPSYRPGRQMGVIAQELREVFPDLVREGDDGFLTVDYAGLLAPVIEALKELDARLALIEERISSGREDPAPGTRPEGDDHIPPPSPGSDHE